MNWCPISVLVKNKFTALAPVSLFCDHYGQGMVLFSTVNTFYPLKLFVNQFKNKRSFLVWARLNCRGDFMGRRYNLYLNYQKGSSVLIISLVVVFLALSGCAPGEPDIIDPAEEKQENEDVQQEVSLPSPEEEGEATLESVLLERESRRSFAEDPLSLREIGQLLWAGQGIDGMTGATRTAPSAGGTHPLEIYLVTKSSEDLQIGVHRYDPVEHTLKTVVTEDRRNMLAKAALGQDFIAEAPVNLVLVAHYERTTATYGERGKRYVKMEAGHAGQNICLQAEALGLNSVVIGAFDDNTVRELLDTEADPLAVIPVGYP